MLTIADVRASQNLARSGLPWLARRVFVPLSWPLSAGAAGLGLSPNQATALRAIVAAGGLALIPFTLWGIAVFVLAVILDYVDGALARLQDRATYFGKFLDGLVDIAGDVFFLPAIALHLTIIGAPTWIPPLAMAGGLALAVAFIALYRLPLFELQAGVSSGIPTSRLLWLIDLHGANALFNARFATLPLVVVDVAAYAVLLGTLQLAFAALIVTARVKRAQLSLNKPRKSRSAA